jgi:hypothetical protein
MSVLNLPGNRYHVYFLINNKESCRRCMLFKSIIRLSFSYPYPTKRDRYNMFFIIVIKLRILFLRPACLKSTLLKTGVGANHWKCSRDQQLKKRAFQSTEEFEIINFGCPSDDWLLRTLLSLFMLIIKSIIRQLLNNYYFKL